MLLLGMLPLFSSQDAWFALAATAFGVLLMLLPGGQRRLRMALVITSVSFALGVVAVFGTLGAEGPPGALQRLGFMLGLFWILPLTVLSLSYALRFEPSELEAPPTEGSEEAS